MAKAERSEATRPKVGTVVLIYEHTKRGSTTQPCSESQGTVVFVDGNTIKVSCNACDNNGVIPISN